MDNFFDTLIKLSLGTMAMTREKAEKLINELTKKGAVSRSEARKLLGELTRKGEQSEKELRTQAAKVLAAVMKKLDFPTRREINELKAEIAALKKSRSRRARKNR
jgi:polyhydroxyalkanoate synthesis regulator phasin